MALAESAGGVSTWPTNASAATTGTITPASGDLLVAIAVCGNGDNAAATSIAMSGTGAMSGTWTLLAHLYLTTGPMAAVFVKDAGASPSSGTATATFSSPIEGSGLIVRRFAGAAAAASQTGVTATAGSAGGGVYTKAITPGTTGSRVVGGFADSSNSITLTANASSTIYNKGNGSGGDTLAAFEASSASTGGTPVTLGFTNTGSDSTSLVLVEILPATGVTHTASASLTVTPSLSATDTAVHLRSASLTVTPVLSATDTALHVRSASLMVTPSLSSTAGFTGTASLTVTPSLSGSAAVAVHASLTVTPVLSAADTALHLRAASLTVTPVLSGSAAHVSHRTASLTVTPAFSATRAHKAAPHASLTVTPVLVATAALSTGGEPGYPDGPLGAMLEFKINGTWTDVTRWAMPDGRQSGQVTGGQPDGAQQPNPGMLPVQLDNGDFRFSPGNTSGPYYPYLRQNTPARLSFNSPYGHYLRCEADNSDRAFVNDNATLHVTGSIEIRVGARLSDHRGCVLAARYDNTTPSWYWLQKNDGGLTFSWFDSGGTQRTVSSPTAASVSWRAYRVTMDATNGNVQFYVSDGIDGTWTSMGAAASGTGGAATSVRAGNAPLVVGWSSNGLQARVQLLGHLYGFRLYSGIGGTVKADAAFPAQSPGATSWTDAAGNAWNVAGGAELTNRDYRLHGELASVAPTAAGMAARMQATVAGRMRRLQSGKQPTVESPLRRAIRTQAGSLFPVLYIPMEDGGVSGGTSFGALIGGNALTAVTGAATPAADQTFEASAALPLLNGAVLTAAVPAYSGATAWALRFPLKLGGSVPAGAEIARLTVTGGACATVKLLAAAPSGLQLVGLNGGGGTVFDSGVWDFGASILAGELMSVEATASGGSTDFAMVSVAPGASSGGTVPNTVSGTFGTVTSVTFNTGGLLTDTVIGHVSVQKAWASLFTLGAPLNAWRSELTADRFARVCAEQGIACRVIGRPSASQPMGAQPRGNRWAILQDCANAEQGILYEPADVLGLGFRTRESLSAHAALTLSFTAAATLRGDLQPSYDDIGLVNDVSASTADGATYTAVLDDGSPRSVSEPEDGGAGDYAGSPVFNLAGPTQLPPAGDLYLKVHSVNEPRYRNVAGDLGIPGAPAADIARVRPGDLIVITGVPGAYQTADIQQLAWGWKEQFGPGRTITFDCVPASPYS